jgi:2-polyprenyl-3-methyl-5-hydroxy-6-metoxy-1,4-benzoquinol methylase
MTLKKNQNVMKDMFYNNKSNLYGILQKFPHNKIIIDIIEKNINKNISDNELYKLIRKKYIKYIPKNDTRDIKRGIYRGKDLEFIGIRFADTSKIKYLDIGCGNGDITCGIASHFNFNKKNIYGMDLIDPFDKNEKKSKCFNYISYDGIHYPKFDFKFDIVTIFQTLHHVKNLESMMNFIRSISKKNTKIIIREHNAITNIEKTLIDIQHFIYGKILAKEVYENFDDIFYSNYKSKIEWKLLFKQYGFKSADSKNIIISDVNDKIYYQIFSPS